MLMFRCNLTHVFAVLLFIGGCQSSANIQSLDAMEPLEGRRAVVGDKVVLQKQSGERFENSVVAVDERFISGVTSDGCAWKLKRNSFAPTNEWVNCESRGMRPSERVSDSIFPMKKGTKETWRYRKADDDDSAWTGTRICETVEQVQITVPAGKFDTFHVRCVDGYWTYEYFLRADGITVKQIQWRLSDGVKPSAAYELVEFVPAKAE